MFTASAITSVDPLDNSHTAPVGTDITATYDQDIDTGGSVTDTTFVVHAMFTGQIVDPPHGNAIAIVGDTITFNPDNDFKPGETIQVIATDGIQNTLAIFQNHKRHARWRSIAIPPLHLKSAHHLW